MAAAAPAYAASPCSTTFPYRLDWGTTAYTKLTADSATATITPSSGTGGTPVTIDLYGEAVGATAWEVWPPKATELSR